MSLMLLLLIVIPLAGAGLVALASPASTRWLALLVSLATAGCGVALASGFDFGQDLSRVPAHQRDTAAVQIAWGDGSDNLLMLQNIGFRVELGVDAVGLWLLLLTVGLTPLAIAASFQSIRERTKEYYAWMLVLLGAMNGVFIAQDLLLFYIFFELTLIPMFFIIGIWGGPERRYAAGKFFLYTFAGGVFTLAGVLYLGLKAGSFRMVDVIECAQHAMSNAERFWLFLAFLAGFAVKVPLFPVHTWLPLAHTEAPTAGSVILAGVLLKLGTYGLIRVALPVGMIGVSDLPAPGVAFPGLLQLLGAISVVGILYGALVAWVQQDIKKLVAYSSVSHLGFCVLGMLALNQEGMQGSVLYMINHGISTGALFLCVGMIYDRFHTRDINALSGLGRRMPILCFFLVLFTMSSIGLPGTNGFVSEFLTVLGAFTSEHLGVGFGAVAALGVILGAVYMLHMVAKVVFGPLKAPGLDGHGHHAHGPDAHPADGDALPPDLTGREIAILVPLALAVFVLGVAPRGVMRSMAGPLDVLRTPTVVNDALTQADAPRLAASAPASMRQERP